MASLTRYRFGVFEFDPETPELRKSGRPVRLRPQGLKLLKLLISRPREVIAREEIARFLWDAGVFVDFEQGVNHTIKQVRAALGDDAESPRYIETLPRRGYRFIAPVEALVASREAPYRADGTGPPEPLELSVREDPAKRTAEIAGGRLELAVNASTSLSQSAPPRVIGRMERHRTAIRRHMRGAVDFGCRMVGDVSAARCVQLHGLSCGTAVHHNRRGRRVFCRRPYRSTHDRDWNDARLAGDCVEHGVLIP